MPKTGVEAPPAAGAEAAARPQPHRAAVLYQYERCCDDWRHHDAIIWEMPLAAISANAVIVWAASAAGHAWHLAFAWALAGLVVGVSSLGLQKQVEYARQIQARIREVEREYGLPKVTQQVGRSGFVTNTMRWLMRGLCFADLAIALIYSISPGWLM
jgi:hypothetical protein